MHTAILSEICLSQKKVRIKKMQKLMKKIFKLLGNVFKGHENLKYGATE